MKVPVTEQVSQLGPASLDSVAPPPGVAPSYQETSQRSEWDDEEVDREHVDLQRALHRFANAAVRGAAIGLTLRGGLHLVSHLLHLLRAAKRGKGGAPPPAAPAALSDSLRYGAFLASLAGVYVGVDESIAAVWGRQRTAAWRALVAGACAGPTLLLTGRQARHYSLATYIVLRGLTLLVRTGSKPGAHPAVRAALAPSRWRHGDVALMCAAASQILYSFAMMPQTLPPSYVRFISKAVGKEPHVWAGLRELAVHNATGAPPRPLAALAATPLAAAAAATPCHFLHPGRTCAGNAAAAFPGAYARALRVYLPVYLLPALLVHRGLLLAGRQRPRLLAKLALGVGRSSLFLGLYVSLAFAGVCSGHRLAGATTGAVIAASVWTGGLATLAEKKSRRMELALYCASRALEAAALCAVQWGWVRPAAMPPRTDVALFSAATAAIMHCYSDGHGKHRDVFRSKYLNILDFVFGNAGMEQGTIRHSPSNLVMLAAVKRSASALRLAALGPGNGGGNGNGSSNGNGGSAAGSITGAMNGSLRSSSTAGAAAASGTLPPVSARRGPPAPLSLPPGDAASWSAAAAAGAEHAESLAASPTASWVAAGAARRVSSESSLASSSPMDGARRSLEAGPLAGAAFVSREEAGWRGAAGSGASGAAFGQRRSVAAARQLVFDAPLPAAAAPGWQAAGPLLDTGAASDSPLEGDFDLVGCSGPSDPNTGIEAIFRRFPSAANMLEASLAARGLVAEAGPGGVGASSSSSSSKPTAAADGPDTSSSK